MWSYSECNIFEIHIPSKNRYILVVIHVIIHDVKHILNEHTNQEFQNTRNGIRGHTVCITYSHT